jgi:hypothetical protein
MTRSIDTTSDYAADIGKWTKFAWGGVANLHDSTGAQIDAQRSAAQSLCPMRAIVTNRAFRRK